MEEGRKSDICIVNDWLREGVVYSLGIGAAFAIDVAILWALVEYCGLHYLLAATVSFLVSTSIAYWISIRHAFRYRRLTDWRSEFGAFATIGAIGIGVNLSLLYLLVETAHLHYVAARIAAGGFTFFMNFALRKLALFTRRGA